LSEETAGNGGKFAGIQGTQHMVAVEEEEEEREENKEEEKEEKRENNKKKCLLCSLIFGLFPGDTTERISESAQCRVFADDCRPFRY
jgi:TATA-binding protein-associated factor Taf7